MRGARAGGRRWVRRRARCDPCGDAPRGWRGRRACACAAGNRASWPGAGCSAGRSACSPVGLHTRVCTGPGTGTLDARHASAPGQGHGAVDCCQAWTRYVAARTRVKPTRRPRAVDNRCGQRQGLGTRTTSGEQALPAPSLTLSGSGHGRLGRQATDPSTRTSRRCSYQHHPCPFSGGPNEASVGPSCITAGQGPESPSTRRQARKDGHRQSSRATCSQGRRTVPEAGPTGYGPVVLQSGPARHAGGRRTRPGGLNLRRTAARLDGRSCDDADSPPRMHSVWTTVWTTSPSGTATEGRGGEHGRR